jgi:hypothetical protein
MAKQTNEGGKAGPSGDAKGKPKPKPAPEGAQKPKDAAAAGKGAAAQEKEKEKEKAKPAPRPPVDPRLKILKKFHGKFLPKGPLRERSNALMQRWNSGPDHGGVTVEELKSLYDDWKSARLKPARTARISN